MTRASFSPAERPLLLVANVHRKLPVARTYESDSGSIISIAEIMQLDEGEIRAMLEQHGRVDTFECVLIDRRWGPKP